MKNGKTTHVRLSQELYDIIRYVEGKSILEGLDKPSHNEITKVIAQMIKKEKVWEKYYDEVR